MKFFEVLTPYYALLKAESLDDAIIEYNASIAGNTNVSDFHEVSRDYALVKFSQYSGSIEKTVTVNEVLQVLNSDEFYFLIIDGSLL